MKPKHTRASLKRIKRAARIAGINWQTVAACQEPAALDFCRRVERAHVGQYSLDLN
jgi:hypothetical protein